MFNSTRDICFISNVKENTTCKIGLHVHNDFGLATANTLEGVHAGADVVSGTFTGIGERAGNAALEEVCVGLKHLYDIDLSVKYEKIVEICSLVESYAQISLQPHKPIIGKHAFAHESGIHADGMLKHPRMYENFDPEFVGHKRQFIFGKHSGRNSLKYALGEHIAESELDSLLQKIKRIAEQHKVRFTEQEVLDLYFYPGKYAHFEKNPLVENASPLHVTTQN